MMALAQSLSVEIWRGTETGRFQTFAIPRREHQTVLDVVSEIQREHDPTLSYRFACRVGMCGSCAMVVNGRPRWTCRTRVSEVARAGESLRLEPLRNFAVVKDLAVEMTQFFDKWKEARGYFEPGAQPPPDFAVVPPATPERQAADAGIECIGCGVCYSACDVVAWDKDYLGPAALNRAWTLVNDVRDQDRDTAARRRVRKRRLPGLSHTHELHLVLPEDDCADLCDRRAETRCAAAQPTGRAVTAILFLAQRASAVVLAFAVAVHLATILYAVRGGLTAADILGRTHGNVGFLIFYAVFRDRGRGACADRPA